MKLNLLAALALTAAAAPAMADPLTNGTGDGQVSLDVNGTGSIGTNSYNPVGPIGAASTIYGSNTYFRIGDSGPRTLLANATVTSFTGDATERTSTFSLGGLDFTLVQSLSDLVIDGQQAGTLLTQSYSFTNAGDTALDLEFTRYLDGDLYFDGNRSDGGGRLVVGGREVLFETDSATGADDLATFLGIYNEGGTSTGYEIEGYSTLASQIGNGTALNNMIAGDTNGDGFVDSRYDLALGLGNALSVGAGGTGTFTTATIFGTGVPGSIDLPGAVPEPASWAMMVAGFGLVGGAVRRRPRRTALTA